MTELLRVRLPATLKELLRQRAREDGRSMNGQLVQILKRHLYKNAAVLESTSKKECV
ncbi:Arc family DNA-binding protein [Aliihoeflea sp. 40Bstr573]|nr:Arc family DNA-binding protein [Aliihoeflea sp. 40Bstr573]